MSYPLNDEEVDPFKRVGNDPNDQNDLRYWDDDILIVFRDRLTHVVYRVEITDQHVAEQDQETEVRDL